MNNLIENAYKIFKDIKYIDENGNEYWYARELMQVLEYSKWERFSNAIDNAKVACKNSGYNVENQFSNLRKLIKHDKGGNRKRKKRL